jgi:hypothetical protein
MLHCGMTNSTPWRRWITKQEEELRHLHGPITVIPFVEVLYCSSSMKHQSQDDVTGHDGCRCGEKHLPKRGIERKGAQARF